MIDEWDLTATNLRRTRRRKYQVAVLPVGTIEPHNLHLPYGMDFLHATHVARESCRKAWARCPKVLCLPTLPFSVDANMLAYPCTTSVSQATVNQMAREIFAGFRGHGLRKFVLLNAHGGNEFIPFVRQAQVDLDAHIFLIDWWKVGADRYSEFFTRPDDHAGQFETSVALALFPERVELAHAGDGAVRPFRFEALRRGWVRTSRDFGKLSDHCGVGNPQGASADAGRKYLALVTDRIADFLAELAQAPIDATFPFAELPGSRARARRPKRRAGR